MGCPLAPGTRQAPGGVWERRASASELAIVGHGAWPHALPTWLTTANVWGESRCCEGESVGWDLILKMKFTFNIGPDHGGDVVRAMLRPWSCLVLSLSLGGCTSPEAIDPDDPFPRLELVSPANGSVAEQIEATVVARVIEAPAAEVRWSVGGTALGEQPGPIAPGTEVSQDLSLTSGSNVITIEAIGEAGGGDVREVVIFLDVPAPPVLTLLSPEPGAVIDASSVWVQGEVIAEQLPTRAEVGTDDQVLELDLIEQASGVWSFSEEVSLAFGDNALWVEIEDPAGQQARLERQIRRVADEVPPTLSSIWPPEGHGVASTAPIVWGRVEDNDVVASVELEQDGVRVPAVLQGDGRFQGVLALEPGASSWSVVTTDAAGNESIAVQSVWLGSRVAAGGSHSGWIHGDGTLYMWGRNNIGQVGLGYTSELGDVSPAHPDVPTAVSLAVQPVSLAAYQNTTVLLDSTGGLWSWGDNGSGQLGLGTPDPADAFDATDRSSPTAVPGVSTAVTLAGGYTHTLALLDDGTVVAMGDNGSGQLGDGSTDDRDHAVAVAGLADVVQIAAASSTSFALTSAGVLYAWGANDYGQLGNGTEDDLPHSTPVVVPGLPAVAQVAAGRDHVLVVDLDGVVWAWGLNASHQVGGYDHGLSADAIWSPAALTHLGTATAVYANGNQSYHETEDALLLGWGQNGSTGALGIPISGDLDEPVDPVFGLTDLVDVGVGALHSVALRADGQAFAWGWSFEGSLGAGSGVIDAWGYQIPILVQLP